MGTIYATTPLRSPPVPSTPGRKNSHDRTGLWLVSPTGEHVQNISELSVSLYLASRLMSLGMRPVRPHDCTIVDLWRSMIYYCSPIF